MPVNPEDFGAVKISARPEDFGAVPIEQENGILKNLALGAVKGASDIGATLLTPLDMTGVTGRTPEERRKALKDFFAQNATTDSAAFKVGEIGSQIAGTAGIGGVIARPFAAIAPKLAAALESGGVSLGNAPAATTTVGKAADLATRIGAGAVTGGAMAGAINPEEAATGAAFGSAFQVAAGAVRSIGVKVAPEVAQLYQRAKQLGIEIPADRIVNSRPLNMAAASLNYIPFSGRAATEDAMLSQTNRALSRTIGQDTDNMAKALADARRDLGAKFDQTLSTNGVKVDSQFLNDLVNNLSIAAKELPKREGKLIGKQVDEIINKVDASGVIDGQTAYNIKKSLDRIGSRNAPEAYYAREVKRSLMDALNRSLGPQQASEFAKVRQQYGNMLELENIVPNGAEGAVTAGRLANMRDIRSGDLQEIADIAAQFLKTRENPHGAAQRVVLGTMAAGLGGATGTLPAVGATIVGARGMNEALNSNWLRSLILNSRQAKNALANTMASPVVRGTPIAIGASD